MKTETLKKIAETLEDIGFCASVAEASEAVPMDTLLAALPGEAEEGHFMVCTPMEEDDNEYTAYIQMYYEIPMDIEGIDERDLWRAVNKMNTVTLAGHFAAELEDERRKRIYMRHSFLYDVEAGVYPLTFCDCMQKMLEYGAMMEEILAGLHSGMDLDTILEAEELTGEE